MYSERSGNSQRSLWLRGSPGTCSQAPGADRWQMDGPLRVMPGKEALSSTAEGPGDRGLPAPATRRWALSRGRSPQKAKQMHPEKLKHGVTQGEGQRERQKTKQKGSAFCRWWSSIPGRAVGLKRSHITSKPCSLPTFIMSLQRFGTTHMTSTALCGVGGTGEQSEPSVLGPCWSTNPPIYPLVQFLPWLPASGRTARPGFGRPPPPVPPGTGCFRHTPSGVSVPLVLMYPGWLFWNTWGSPVGERQTQGHDKGDGHTAIPFLLNQDASHWASLVFLS